MDFIVMLARPGRRVTLRKRQNSKIGANHRVSKQECIDWFKQKFEGNVY